MRPVSVFKKSYYVELRDVDLTKKLKLSALFNYMQEISSLHVENLGTGIEAIEKRCGVTWILMRAKAEIARYPSWNEDITIETWHQKPKKFEFERDFIVRDAAGNVIIRMVSMWIIIDIKTRKLKKSESIAVQYPPFFEERAMTNFRLGKIKPFAHTKIAYKKTISYSDTDINGHINNAKYIDFATDCFPVEKHLQYYIKSMQINYIREAMPGDNIAVYTDISDLNSNIVYIGGIEESGSPIFNTIVEIVPVKDRPELLQIGSSAQKPNWGWA
jgi:medium-chain acyl-[acyl-carrier-protein] hydrolase